MKYFKVFLLALTIVLLAGCIDTKSPTDRAADKIDATIAALDRNSADWQRLVYQLDADLQKIEKNVAIDVEAIIQRGIETGGVEFRCDVDFIGNRVKEDLQRLSANLRGKIPPPVEPVVCQIDFSPSQVDEGHINMANIPDEVLFYGYNFDITTENSLEMMLRYRSGEMSLQKWVNKPTHYLLTLKTAATDGVPMCNLEDRVVTLRWGGKELYSLGVIANACPAPPQAPTPRPEKDLSGTPVTDTTYGKFLGGTGLNKEYGGNCSNGYMRSSFQVITTNSQGVGSVTADGVWSDGTKLGWVDENDNKNCKIRVHYSISASSPNVNPNFVEVNIVIKEKGEQLPPPETPPCLCK